MHLKNQTKLHDVNTNVRSFLNITNIILLSYTHSLNINMMCINDILILHLYSIACVFQFRVGHPNL